jgi:hypothetical protein
MTNNGNKTFRPWNTDSIGDVVDENPGSVKIRYRHDPAKTYDITRKELGVIGRFVVEHDDVTDA